MLTAVLRAVSTTAFILLSLLLWRGAYALGDFGVLALVPLAAVLFLSHRDLLIGIYRARKRVLWRDEAWLSRWLTGRIGATFWALVLVVLAVPLLGWQVLGASPKRLALLGAIFFTTSLLYSWLATRLAREVQPPFERYGAVRVATALVLPFVIVMAWYSFYNEVVPARLLNATLGQVPQIAIEGLPHQTGWIATLMTPLQIYETGKFWLAGQLAGQRWFAVLVSLDAALFGFIMARAAAVTTHFLHIHRIGERDDRQ